ncbi:UDP-N-acetylmuramate--L-alanine ligase [Anaplasmataceae bacterium AB001_6]|nr:UDP-N-acetylmuramate--L-alanine ligase [Anaplasmataceae bacterium AB001_6]
MQDIFLTPKNLTIHIIGIGGAGMSAIAKIMLSYGFKVQGSDLNTNSPFLENLEKQVELFDSHEAKNILEADIVIYSSAITNGNIEIQHAQSLGLIILSRRETLELISKRYNKVVAVSGSHGKTTVTAMIASLLSPLNPTVLCGGEMRDYQSNVVIPKDNNRNILVIEADESDNTFNFIKHDISIITNCSPDHLDFYGNMENLKKHISLFINTTNDVVFIEQDTSKEISVNDDKNIKTYSLNDSSDIYAVPLNKEIRNNFTFCDKENGKKIDIQFNLNGKHNILNALSAISVALRFGIKDEDIQKSFREFTGVKKRMDILLESEDLSIIYDYAHHPKEILNTIDAVKQIYNHNTKIIAVIQIHKLARLTSLKQEFNKIFQKIDVQNIILTPIYEPKKTNNKTENVQLNEFFKENEVLCIINSNEEISECTIQKIRNENNYCIIFMGAGDINKYAHDLVKRIKHIEIPN